MRRAARRLPAWYLSGGKAQQRPRACPQSYAVANGTDEWRARLALHGRGPGSREVLGGPMRVVTREKVAGQRGRDRARVVAADQRRDPGRGTRVRAARLAFERKRATRQPVIIRRARG